MERLPKKRLCPPTETFCPMAETLRPPTEAFRPTAETLRPPTEVFRPTAETLCPPTEAFRPATETLRPTAETFRQTLNKCGNQSFVFFKLPNYPFHIVRQYAHRTVNYMQGNAVFPVKGFRHRAGHAGNRVAVPAD